MCHSDWGPSRGEVPPIPTGRLHRGIRGLHDVGTHAVNVLIPNGYGQILAVVEDGLLRLPAFAVGLIWLGFELADQRVYRMLRDRITGNAIRSLKNRDVLLLGVIGVIGH